MFDSVKAKAKDIRVRTTLSFSGCPPNSVCTCLAAYTRADTLAYGPCTRKHPPSTPPTEGEAQQALHHLNQAPPRNRLRRVRRRLSCGSCSRHNRHVDERARVVPLDRQSHASNG